MCLPRPSRPSRPAVDPNVQAMRDSQEATERRKIADNKEEALEERVRRMRGGSGLRSLLTSNRGGLGYYSDTI